MGDQDTHLIHGSLGPPVLNQSDILIGSAILQGLLMSQTDRPRYSVGNNRSHLRSMGNVV